MECRRSVRDMSSSEKAAYVSAVLALKSAPSRIPAAQSAVTAGGGTPNRYDDYVWIHNVVGFGAHRGPAFGPWHREFVRQFELDLRDISGDTHLCVPYWDWTVDRTPADPGWPFTNDFMGGFGGSSPAFEVTIGPFSNPATWRINIRDDGVTRLKRSIGTPAPNALLPQRTTVLGGLGIGAYDVSPFHSNPASLTAAQRAAQTAASFRKYLEWLMHDGIHVWIGGATSDFSNGGHMTFPSVAVNDPIFFLHHANVDRLYTIWQQRNPAVAGYAPASGANGGHNLSDVMANFGTASHFAHPLANRPTDQIDWHARNIWYACDLPDITPVSLSVNFGNVPQGLTTYRPVQFEVRTCQPVHFRITGITAGTNFSVPPSQGIVTVDHSALHDPVIGNVYVAFEALPPLSSAQAGSVMIEAYIEDVDGYFAPAVNGEFIVGTWPINLTAVAIPRPRNAVVMVLDRSFSMNASAGPAGTRHDLLTSALQVASDLLAPDDAIGLVSYDHLVDTVAPMTPMGALSPPGAGRVAVSNAITGGALTPRGNTAIGQGMITGASVLDAERTSPTTPYDQFSMLVMTDGNENVTPYVTHAPVTTAISGFSNRVFAVGLGDEGDVSAATLSAIARYMLITGDITTAEQRFRLTKYFVQILAAVTNTAIVVDPQGDLHIGVEHRHSFFLTEADVETDVIAISPAAFLLDFRLEAPDGTIIQPTTASPNVMFHMGREDAFYRLGLPAIPGSSGTHAGKWTAVLRIARTGFGRFATHGMLSLDHLATRVGNAGTLPYSVVVKSRSNLRFNAHVQPAVAEPGETLRLHARLVEYDVPVERRARVQVEVRDPAGALYLVSLSETAPGAFSGQIETTIAGVYTLRFRAAGSTFAGQPFQQEQTRTAAVLVPRPAPEDSGGTPDGKQHLCELLSCLIETQPRVFQQLGVDTDALRRCLKRWCVPQSHAPFPLMKAAVLKEDNR